MLAEWTPARALVAEILDENLGRIESWFSAAASSAPTREPALGTQP